MKSLKPFFICLSALFILVSGLMFYGESGLNFSDISLITEIRFPKIIVAFLAGGLLATGGLLLQVYFQNPLAGPDLLGINSGASLGIALSLMGFAHNSKILAVAQPLAAFIGALIVMLFLGYLIKRKMNRTTILIIGLLIASFTSSIISVLINLAPGIEVKSYLVWAMGTFQGVPLQTIPVFTLTAVVLIVPLFTMPVKLNVLSLGDDYALSMGLKVNQFKFFIIVLSAMISAFVTIFCGPIGFIGIIAPHVARWLVKRSDHRVIMIATFFVGAMLGLVTESALVATSDYSLTTNSILGLIGAPIIALYLLKDRRSL